MGIKVAKFGGSSVADGIQLAKMREIIEQDADRKYIIVSAPGKRFPSDTKVTDLLYLCMTQKENNIPYDQVFQVIEDRFMAVKMNLGLEVDLKKHFDEIKKNMDFFLYGFESEKFNYEHLSGSWKTMKLNEIAKRAIEWLRKPLRKALKESKHFTEPFRIENTAKVASEILSIGNQYGEGWLLTGEMIELIRDGVENIVCLQPFGCLPNHVTGKGMMKAIRKMNPQANIAAIDYDPGASDVNQLNRIYSDRKSVV